LFAVLLFALIRIAQKTQDVFQRYFVLGVATWIAAQAFINIAVVLRLAPVLGVPLPLISQGGTSMVAVLGALGIVLGIERQNHLGGSAKYAGTVPRRSNR
jgi:cell division protein FtsW